MLSVANKPTMLTVFMLNVVVLTVLAPSKGKLVALPENIRLARKGLTVTP
jgi:hypothetical protein